ncbi:MAG: AMP-binding protein, partial [Bacteroidota bacterium]
FQALDFRHLKIAVGGGMAVQRPVAEAWQKLTGVPLSEGYGLTESSPSACMNPLNGNMRIGTIGVPLPSTDMRVWNEDENRLATTEERGEIQIKGPQVMKGYYNRPEETAKVMDGDWLKTGDIGMMSEDGFFRIVDRKKDMILVSGFNVFPNEVEDVIAAHPGVLEVAAIGIPSEKSGEVVKVFIVRKDKSLKEDDVIAYAKENLTGYKVPKAVEFREDLPKSNVGKIIRRHLREA